jgi:hypothetical protein
MGFILAALQAAQILRSAPFRGAREKYLDGILQGLEN